VISVTFDEDKGMPRAIITIIVIFLLFVAIPAILMSCKAPKYVVETPKTVERSTPTPSLHTWSGEQVNWVRANAGQLYIFLKNQYDRRKVALSPKEMSTVFDQKMN
jgi:hypothetical protein